MRHVAWMVCFALACAAPRPAAVGAFVPAGATGGPQGGAVVRVAGFAVHAGPSEDLTESTRRYLAFLGDMITWYDAAPASPAPYAADPVGYAAWERSVFFPYLEAFGALVPSPGADPAGVDGRAIALGYAALHARWASVLDARVGGPPGYWGCPETAPERLGAALQQAVTSAERCLEIVSDVLALAESAAACERTRAWARGRLEVATPPAPDACMEDFPDPTR
jgi:hypothetical protein